jgi:hypothetical protein
MNNLLAQQKEAGKTQTRFAAKKSFRVYRALFLGRCKYNIGDRVQVKHSQKIKIINNIERGDRRGALYVMTDKTSYFSYELIDMRNK